MKIRGILSKEELIEKAKNEELHLLANQSNFIAGKINQYSQERDSLNNTIEALKTLREQTENEFKASKPGIVAGIERERLKSQVRAYDYEIEALRDKRRIIDSDIKKLI